MADASNNDFVQNNDVGDILAGDNPNLSEVKPPPEDLGSFLQTQMDKEDQHELWKSGTKTVIFILHTEVAITN